MRGVVIIIRLVYRFSVWNEGSRKYWVPTYLFICEKSSEHFCLLAPVPVCGEQTNRQTNEQDKQMFE